ncbi:MAG: ATP-binding protein, partial [Kiritimatiellae bacterium]|nr:ATP-binding protein [Kiritimatiellia bacterium]
LAVHMHNQAALRESEIKYHALFDTASDAILLMSNKRFVDCNERALKVFGCRRDEIIGACPSDFSPRLQPDGSSSEQKATALIGAAISDGLQFFEWEHCHRDGNTFAAEVSLNRLDLEGQTLIQAIVRDVTARKMAERELRELNFRLEERVAERTADLAVAKDLAEAADRVKSAFLATMSHELRTPLNSIIGFTGILLQEMAGPLNEEQRKQLTMVRDSSRHLLELINDVLDISKIEAGQLEIRKTEFALAESVNKVAGLIRPLAENKKLTLLVLVPENTGIISSDKRRVEQIMLNLLNNAVKFTDQGFVRLTAERDEKSIRISVSDTGIGIKTSEISNLFRPFKQLDSGLARLHEGTGLGLAICKRLTQLLCGEINVTSEFGKGSVFTVTLPVDNQEAPV